MMGNGTDKTQDRLALPSRLSEIARIPVWIRSLASRHAMPEKVQFAINLCLEEVVANIIRHSYREETDRSVSVRFTMPQRGLFVFVVEDEAPGFNPLDASDMPPPDLSQQIQIGGQGLRLVRRFADSLEYERTSTGNRLRLSFSAAPSAV